MSAPVLDVVNLQTHIAGRAGPLKAVNNVSFHVAPGETLGVVGESGCGKSMTALSIMRLVPAPAARIVGGAVRFEGQDLLALPERAMRAIRGNRLAMIFQEPMTALNPVRRIGGQMAEGLMLHQKLGRSAALARAEEMLHLVHIPDARARLDDYPHNLSGGMRQRVVIAMALACDPQLLLADEPTTALDVTTQAQIMRLLAELRARLGTATVLITHDLGLVAENVDRVIVMYGGAKVEEAPVRALFAHPGHPYTRGLLGSVPRLGRPSRQRLVEIPGTVPPLDALPPGCAYATRCPLADEVCRSVPPALEIVQPGHSVACWHAARAEEIAA